MAFREFFESLWGLIKKGGKKSGVVAVAILKVIGPLVGKYILEIALSKATKNLDGLIKKEKVREQVRDALARHGLTIPESLLQLSIEEQYQRLKAEGKLPGSDYASLEALIPRLEAAVRDAVR